MQIRKRILELAQEVGFQRTAIASIEPMIDEGLHYQNWINQGYAATMDYLKRNPESRNDPRTVFPAARSVIVSYYTVRPLAPGPFFGDVASYAVGLDYHSVLRAKFRLLKARIESEIGRHLLGKAFTDDVPLNELGLAARSGLGFKGRHTLIIGPKLSGSFNFIGELFTDLELEPDEVYKGTCGKCFRCGDKCPTGAIMQEGELNSNLCISFLTIENKSAIPVELRPKIGNWVFGCDICQEVCPYNQRPPITPWKEFLPESGVGHHLNLPELLSIKTDKEFFRRFQNTPLLRPKRRGILRNALVVMGNILHSIRDGIANSAYISSTTNHSPSDVATDIFEFAKAEPDSILREHAAWALSQLSHKVSKVQLEKLIKYERELETKALMLQHRSCL